MYFLTDEIRMFILVIGISLSVSTSTSTSGSDPASLLLSNSNPHESAINLVSDIYLSNRVKRQTIRVTFGTGCSKSTKLKIERTLVLKWKDLKSMCEVEDTALIYLGFAESSTNYNRNNLTCVNSLADGRQLWIDLRQNFTPEHELRIEEFSFSYLGFFIGPPPVGLICVEEDKKDNPDLTLNHRGRATKDWSIYPMNKTTEIDLSTQSYYINETDGKPVSLLDTEAFDNGLVKIFEDEDTVYVNETSHFNCRTQYNVQNLTFWIEFGNGTKIMLEKGVPIQFEIEHDPRIFSRVRMWKLNVNLTTEIVAVSCEIPYLHHPTLYKAAVRRFKPKYLKEPKLDRDNYGQRQLFVCGETHKRLMCKVEGEPRPTFVWFKDDMDLKEFPNLSLRAMIGNESEGILEFPVIRKAHEGEYTCQASNRIGVDQLLFTVFVQDAPSEHHEVSSIAPVIVSFIFIVVMSGLLIFVYKKYRSKKRIREQIGQEFDHGTGISFMRLLS